MEEIEALVALSTVPYLGSIKIRLLVRHFGSASAVLTTPLAEIQQLPGLGEKIVAGIGALHQQGYWKKELELVDKLHIKLIPWTSPAYPKRLLEIDDYPALLYVKGELKSSDAQSIAVVGTRHPTIYGLEMAEKFGRELAAQNFTVVSGLARGIDTAAHRGALKYGRTLAVIGSGLADIYPAENKRLAEEIAQRGAVISEFSMKTPPDKQNFPQRNRIVSGMSLGTLLVEAPLKSGAMITMEKTKQYKRKTFAIPGQIGEHSEGNHASIKRGAQLVENVQDIISSFECLFQNIPTPCRTLPVLDKEEEKLWNALSPFEMTLEEISRIFPIPIAKLNVLLMSLMIKKAIREYPGKIYKKVL